jgi:type I restriction enzyme S subunit
MTPQELRASILQQAIQGKLVEQCPEEGTGEKLFQQILEEKRPLIAAGFFKKDKPLTEIAEEEIPFDIPDTWKWVRLDDVVKKSIKRGKSPTYTPKSGTLVFAQKCNTKAGYINLDIALFLDETKLAKYPDEEFLQDCDIVINSTGNGTLGRVGMYRDADNPRQLPIVPDSHVTVIRTNTTVCVDYVYYVLKYYQPYMEKLGTGSTNQTELNANIVRALLFPLPPAAEQKRIVSKLKEILPLIDRYEAAWNKLEAFNKRFPGDMQKSILQLAIQGKLVDQRPEEGTGEELFQQIQSEKQALIKAGKIKKEKPLPDIAEDEIPFDIPETWKWVRLGDVASINGGFAFKSTNYTPTGVRVVRISDFNECGFVNDNIVRHPYDESLSQYVLDIENILLCMTGGTVGKSLFVTELDERMVVNQRVATIKVKSILPDYVYQVILAPITQKVIQYSKNSTNDNISMDTIKNFLIPLPPLEEQRRIVAKLKEILPLCERLK